MGQPGFVYVLTNPSMPGLVKVGMTDKHPTERAQQLRSTGVPSPFVIEFAAYSGDAAEMETRVHGRLEPRRHSADREFFKCHEYEAIHAVIEEHENLEGYAVEAGEMVWSHNRAIEKFAKVIGNDKHPFELAAALEHLAPDEFVAAWSRYQAKLERHHQAEGVTCPTE